MLFPKKKKAAKSKGRRNRADAWAPWEPAKAEKHLTEAYLSLHTFKFGMDQMEEIPARLRPLYDQTIKVLGHLHTAQSEAHQLTAQTRRETSRYRGSSEWDRFNDLQKQGFMKPLKKKRAPKAKPPTVACSACLNWHPKGKHTAPAAERKKNLREAGISAKDAQRPI